MSFREKTAWVCLLTTLIVYIPYFAFLFGIASREEISFGVALGSFIAAVVVQVVIHIGFGIAMALGSKPEPRDERDAAIDSRAVRFAYYLLATAGFVAVPLYAMLAVHPDTMKIVSTVLFAQLFLFCFVLAEVSRFTMQIIGYRRGA